MTNPLCQKLTNLDQIPEVVIEKTSPYFIRGCGHLYEWQDKYCFSVTDHSRLGYEFSATVDYFISISFTDEDIERIEQKDKLWIYLK
jgi:hypothetical protein